MLRSQERIITTHAGSLPRRRWLAELHGRRSRGESIKAEELDRAIVDATVGVIAAQLYAGVNVSSGGEQARESFVTYVQRRITGFAGVGGRPEKPDLLDHPDFMDMIRDRRGEIDVDHDQDKAGQGVTPQRGNTGAFGSSVWGRGWAFR